MKFRKHGQREKREGGKGKKEGNKRKWENDRTCREEGGQMEGKGRVKEEGMNQ